MNGPFENGTIPNPTFKMFGFRMVGILAPTVLVKFQDIEKLRPKPLDFDMSAALTPPPAYYADSQPSPSVAAAQVIAPRRD